MDDSDILEKTTCDLKDYQIKHDLSFAYRILDHLGMSDFTYTHLSSRSARKNSFYIYPLGLLFSEVFAKDLIELDLEGNIISGDKQYNRTGYIIHANVYKARDDINSVFHLHTIDGVAVSAMADGLLPLSQFSYHFFNKMSYYDYDALAIDNNRHGNAIIESLGCVNKNMILRNHGTLSCGSTIHEAFFYAMFLEKACKVQCKAMNATNNLSIPADEICALAQRNMQDFEKDLGLRDWLALKRKFANL